MCSRGVSDGLVAAEYEDSNTGLIRLGVNKSTQLLSLKPLFCMGCGGLRVVIASSIRTENKDSKQEQKSKNRKVRTEK
jgi:hypothetical protein|tara:strand:- start:6 stop:239 length:234 start_codon:yes stop_codon:yes gene_type:complete